MTNWKELITGGRKEVTKIGEVNEKEIRAVMGSFFEKNERLYGGVRFYWTGDDGVTRPTKNGISIDITTGTPNDSIKAIELWISALNEYYGTRYFLGEVTDEATGTETEGEPLDAGLYEDRPGYKGGTDDDIPF